VNRQAELPEPRRNALLRRVDWRFLLGARETPRALDAGSGAPESIALAFEPGEPRPGGADLVVLGAPGGGAGRKALAALRPGGEAVCRFRLPLPGGAQRARRRLERAGLEDVRLYWPGPVAHRLPEFWLPLGAPAAGRHLLAQRPPRSPLGSAARAAWRLGLRTGSLAPIWAVARAPGSEPEPDAIEELVGGPSAWLLLTGGRRSINKAVGLPFPRGRDEPESVVKFARVPEAEPGLAREAEVLRKVAEERPAVPGVPRVLGEGRRSGRLALVETAVAGRSLMPELNPATFLEHGLRLSSWLGELAGEPPPQPESEWRGRLVDETLEEFERTFGPVARAGTVERARRALGRLGDLPVVCEHRDCAPWNVLIDRSGRPALLDWESAEPRGLPVLDLVYFLANAAFVLDGALESGRTRESYRRLLDPASRNGGIAASCIDGYAGRLGIGEEQVRGLRLLCWLVHCRSDYRHLEMEAAGEPGRGALREAMFLGLVEEEVGRL
jgi:hypothetical protein